MKTSTIKIKLTLLSTMLFVAVTAILIKFFIWAIFPAYNLINKRETYFEQGMVEFVKPFWPCYWRMLRNIPEPSDPEEICRSDDGGFILMAVIATTVALLLAYRFRKYLVRRV